MSQYGEFTPITVSTYHAPDALLRQAIEALRETEFHLVGALTCPKWEWDGDQREWAEMSCDKARAVLASAAERGL